ncbi:MAG: aminotransferase class I/II-fold pyridoxal phosphate-dependent enzyme [Coriobacteriia bacterium]|nr:aminotransferase class I/II-fold pyridoxal phosphate-dependent enzyme [Coriobacteriia bacterium]
MSKTIDIIKYRFYNDYSELAHPDVLAALAALGTTQFDGYGLDEFSDRARDAIRAKIELPEADVHFISGGTHTNLILIAAALRPFEAVISSNMGHINTHETGAIEATGHKVCTAAHTDGKIDVPGIAAQVNYHTDEHMVKPRLVYISQSTELGTVYNKAELQAISDYCRANDLFLYADGARLGAALNSPACDMSYNEFAQLVDAFYIGGTKNGALFGEALVITNDQLKPFFRFHLKQRAALLAKGAALGVQFEALLAGTLYDDLALHANRLGLKLAAGITALGYELLTPPETNQVFPIFPVELANRLHSMYGFHDWENHGDKTSIRLVASWATPEAMVDLFLADLAELS